MAGRICVQAAMHMVGVSAAFQQIRPLYPAAVSNFNIKLQRAISATSSRFLSKSESNSGAEHTVTWITREHTVDFLADDGATLRTAALRSGAVSPHNHRANLINCRGLGTCGTCAVSVSIHCSDQDHDCDGIPPPPPPIEPSERSSIENWRLSLPPGHGPRSMDSSELRLACQVQVRGNITVSKYAGFWGQNIGHLAEKSLPTQPLGELEFILDIKKSPHRTSLDTDSDTCSK